MISSPALNSALRPFGHIPALDGVRGIAVLMVICFHYFHAFTHGSQGIAPKLAVWGQTGVDLFFVLSGFLITGILLDSKNSPAFLRNFYARRVLRIFPLYYGTLFAFYVVRPLVHAGAWLPWKQSLWYWFYLQNIPATFQPAWLGRGPGHFWSLAVEEHFYLLWPFLVLRLSHTALLKTAGVAVVLALLTRVLLAQYGTFYFTLARMDGLAVGAAIAIFARLQTRGLAPLLPWSKGVFLILIPLLGGLQVSASSSHLPAIQILRGTLIAFLYGAGIVLAIELRGAGALLGSRVLGSVGKYSYGMYVFHPFVAGWLFTAGLPYGTAGLLAAIAATYALAWLSWNLAERRFLSLKRYFEYRPATQPAINLAAGA